MTSRRERGMAQLVTRFLRRPPSQERSQALVGAVIAAFEDALDREERPDADVTVDAILERAGVAVSSFYHYFGDKPSLLGAFVGHLTDRNYRRLVDGLDDVRHPTLQLAIEHTTAHVVAVYCDRPAVTRAAVGIIGRLGLFRVVVLERDRFAVELARVAAPFFPHAPPADVARSMRTIGDAAIGIVTAELERSLEPDRAALQRDIASISIAYLEDRHGPSRSRDVERADAVLRDA